MALPPLVRKVKEASVVVRFDDGSILSYGITGNDASGFSVRTEWERESGSDDEIVRELEFTFDRPGAVNNSYHDNAKSLF